MSFMSWTVLVFLLSTTGTLDAVNQDWLTRVVEIIRTEYSFRNQICIAVNIPEDVNPDDLLTYLENDRWQGKVDDFLNNDEVYKGQHVIAASYANGQHAETRVLEAMNWDADTQGNFLIFYTYLSPCAIRCASETNGRNILNILHDTIPSWDGRSALVFGRPCTHIGHRDINTEEIKTSLLNLKEYGFSANIFRCYKPPTPNFQCVQCFSDPDAVSVADQCVVESEGEGGPSRGPSCSSGQTLTEIGLHIGGSTGHGRSGSGSTGRSSSGSGSRSRSRSGSGSSSRSRSGSGSRSRSHSGSGSRSRSRSGRGSRSRSRSGSGSRSRSRSGRGSRSRSSSRSASPKRRRFGAL